MKLSSTCNSSLGPAQTRMQTIVLGFGVPTGFPFDVGSQSTNSLRNSPGRGDVEKSTLRARWSEVRQAASTRPWMILGASRRSRRPTVSALHRAPPSTANRRPRLAEPRQALLRPWNCGMRNRDETHFPACWKYGISSGLFHPLPRARDEPSMNCAPAPRRRAGTRQPSSRAPASPHRFHRPVA